MIVVEGHVRMAEAGDFDKVRAAAEAQIKASRAEGGCISYAYALDVLDPQVMQVIERWESWEALEAHFRMPHMDRWRSALAGVKFLEREIRAYEVVASRAL